MELPFFYTQNAAEDQTFITLDEENSMHVVQVLRMKVDQKILLTDGIGNLITCVVKDAHKKKCVVEALEKSFRRRATRKVSVAMSLLKNAGRFEWFLEKATELGVTEIIPLVCERTEKLHFRYDRIKNILISAMLQSQQCWLPELREATGFQKIISESHHAQKFIAYCAEATKVELGEAINSATDSQIILIGPEGDFTNKEIELANKNHFVAVSLGETRLRSETAGLVAAALLTR